MISWEKETVIFYHYYYFGIEKPVVVEAKCRKEADKILSSLNYDPGKAINLTLFKPIAGITNKTVNGICYIWVGLENSQNGWATLLEFNELNMSGLI